LLQLKSENKENVEDRHPVLHKGCNDGPTKRRLDFEMIGKEVVISLEKKARFNGQNKEIDDDTSVASSLGPGVGETQELMRETDFLDAKIPESAEGQQDKEVDPSNNDDEIGSDDEEKQSTNLLLTTDDDDNETTVLGLSKRRPKPDNEEGPITQ
jgi:hypothetical protein